MRVVATSDLHGTLPDTPECDVLIVAGDVAPDYGRPGSTLNAIPSQQGWLNKRFVPWLESRPGNPVIIGIAGNHDFALEADWDFASDLPWYYLLDEQVEVDGVKFYGIPWVPNLSSWAFHLPDFALQDRFDAIPADTDIVISHGPPFGYCDRTVPRFGDEHAGAPPALDAIDRVHPAVFICGHIHEGYGWSARDTTMVANVSHMPVDDEPCNRPFEFLLNGQGFDMGDEYFPLTPVLPPAFVA